MMQRDNGSNQIIPERQRVSVRITDQLPTGLFSRTKKKVSATLVDLPATASGATGTTQNPDPKALDYVKTRLVTPMFDLLSEFEERFGVATPHVRLEFNHAGQSDVQARLAHEQAEAHNAANITTLNQFQIERPSWSLNKVILPQSTREQLEVVLGLIKHHKLMFEQWNLASIMRSTATALTLNFYGPSGTGKTLAAHAVAHYLGKQLLTVNYAELESRYVGEMNKNIRRAFETARAADVVLFFDEADSVLGQRLSNVSQAADHGINMARSVMLIELERFAGVAIFASNFVSNYDSAFARRLLHHVRFDLPDLEARQRIYQIHLPAELPLASDVTIDELAAQSEGFSGGEIRNVVLKAAATAASQFTEDSAKQVTRTMFATAMLEVQAARTAIGNHQPTVLVKERLQQVSDNPVIAPQ